MAQKARRVATARIYALLAHGRLQREIQKLPAQSQANALPLCACKFLKLVLKLYILIAKKTTGQLR